MRSSSVEEVGGHGPGDPWEVFTALAILVVEGRTPGGERGYHAGPHCPLPHQLQHKHSCHSNHHVCVQAGALVRQLRVMWGVGVGVTLEVLVAPECEHGAALATTLDTTTAPSHNLRLIEQWNFTIYDRRLAEASATGWSLMAAVRSFLHFSQLSAWLSVSGGRRPPNVLYRLAVTSPVFCSKFTEEAEEHVFPLTYMGQDTSIRVAVRSLPRSEKVPVVTCPELHHDDDRPVDAMVTDSLAPSCSHNNRTDIGRCDEDLRRSVMKAKLVENTRVSRSESPDTQLGESLLDPPHSLTRFPRRYQSPSRSGSPSLETPEHLICRPRPPAPQPSKPPDLGGMMVGPTHPSHPFSWTQARYPLAPIVPPATLDTICTSSADALHHHQQHQHHIQQQQQQQHPYRFDFSSSYQQQQQQQLRRPQVMYNRLQQQQQQMCWPQQQQQQQHLQQQQQKLPHHVSLHLPSSSTSTSSSSSSSSSHLTITNPSVCGVLCDGQHQKASLQVSPRGGKYQHYPEYQMQQQQQQHDHHHHHHHHHHQTHTDTHRLVLLGEYAEPSISDLQEAGPSWLRKGRREYSLTTNTNLNPYSLDDLTDPDVTHGEYPTNTEGEYTREHKPCNTREYLLQKHTPSPPLPFESSLHTSGLLGSDQCSTRVKQNLHTSSFSSSSSSSSSKPSDRTKDYDTTMVLDDQMRPCCSYTGKHLCSSLEDLTDIGTQDECKVQPNPKDLKQELKHRGSVSPGQLIRSKINFELTPKETMEILSVLRQPTPVPPLRMDRHRSQPDTESRSKRELRDNDDNTLSKSWGEKECDNYFRDGGGKRIETSKLWRDDIVEPAYLTTAEREVTKECVRGDRVTETPWTECKKGWNTKSSTSLKGPHHEQQQQQQHRRERCHSENLSRSVVKELASGAENRFLEAIARSGEKQCDIIPSCKTLISNEEVYRTRAYNDLSSDSFDKKTLTTLSESDNRYHGGRGSGAFLASPSSSSSSSSCSQSQCVEAKKITHKTSIFTASSEPTKLVTSQPQKQTSQTLVKSPFSAVLSCIQKEYSRVLSDDSEHCHSLGQLKPVLLEGKEMVKRALNFDMKSCDGTGTKAEKMGTKPSQMTERSSDHTEKTPTKFNGKSVERSVHEATEGFMKSSSLLKHLMTRVHCQTQENTQDNTTQEKRRRRSADTESDNRNNSEADEDTKKLLLLATEDSQEMDVQEEGTDDEVEVICNGKGNGGSGGKGVPIPSASEKAQFRRSLDSATNMVFHSKTGLPLTSSPAPLRKGKRFDYDSTLNCVAAIKRSTSFHCSALYTCESEEDDDEGYGLELNANTNNTHHQHHQQQQQQQHANTHGTNTVANRPTQLSASAPATVTCSNLLGSFEECVLNGRLEPVSTVQGFTAEIAASGAFCPKRTTKPVTVFFYTLCDNDQISSPYMGHINLGKKGYHVPNKGTVQVTLFNPHGTVVKMFVVMYDLSDMPPNSRTFVRQRTLNMPVGASDTDPNAHQWLRYLIHLRFVSSKSGKIYLHTDIRMLIFRKSDADAATLHKTNLPYELRSFTHGPTNPKFSPRK
ncbi:hypothetical protein Pmani_027608 [Petrolisthes manimaculis]|uniref:Atos-like conserved domain-containing protein n=1 Tax=Petrolisthes manimaculis TaxID=1843537 RepID=A0AAE1TWC8_9EUCA|nr:hypothetical protein Pmani_027608 [Petrolisthes manimaculis]